MNHCVRTARCIDYSDDNRFISVLEQLTGFRTFEIAILFFRLQPQKPLKAFKAGGSLPREGCLKGMGKEISFMRNVAYRPSALLENISGNGCNDIL